MDGSRAIELRRLARRLQVLAAIAGAAGDWPRVAAPDQEASKSMTEQQMQAEIARLKAENESLKASKGGKVTKVKLSEKGAVSVYGVGRFPVTLYREQWDAIFAAQEQIRKVCAGAPTKAEKQAMPKASGF